MTDTTADQAAERYADLRTHIFVILSEAVDVAHVSATADRLTALVKPELDALFADRQQAHGRIARALDLLSVLDGIAKGIRDPYGHGPLADTAEHAIGSVRRALTAQPPLDAPTPHADATAGPDVGPASVELQCEPQRGTGDLAPTPPTTWTHDGVTIDLTREYTDSDGDTWRWTGTLEPLMTCKGIGSEGLRDNLTQPFAEVIRDYGPLTPVADPDQP
jgi:hypothetical protein